MSSFEPRWYRKELHRSSLAPFAVRFRETDLWVAVPPRQNTPALRQCCEEAATALVDLMRRNRAWEDDKARKQLLKYFEAWGNADPATVAGRKKLSAVLFS